MGRLEHRHILLLLALVALLAAAVAAADPVSIEVDNTVPARGSYMEYTVTVRTTKTLYMRVYVAIYVPGKGWSGWEKVWDGKAYGLASASGKYYIPSDAGNGSVVILVDAYYYSDRDYAVIDGERKMLDIFLVQVAGYLAPREAELWYTRYKALEEKCSRLNESYRSLLSEKAGLEAEYSSLKEKCSALNSSYARLLDEKRVLEARLDALQGRLAGEEALNRVFEVALALVSAVAVALALHVATRRHPL